MRTPTVTTLLIAISILLAPGCSLTPGASGLPAVGPNGVPLTLGEVYGDTRAGGIDAADGGYFLTVEPWLRNIDDPIPVPVHLGLFSIQTVRGRRVEASAVTARVDETCAGSRFLHMNSAVTCRVLFEMPKGDQPVALTYRDPATSRELTVAVPAFIGSDPVYASCEALVEAGFRGYRTPSCVECRAGCETGHLNECTRVELECVRRSDHGCKAVAACLESEACRRGESAVNECLVSRCRDACR